MRSKGNSSPEWLSLAGRFVALAERFVIAMEKVASDGGLARTHKESRNTGSQPFISDLSEGLRYLVIPLCGHIERKSTGYSLDQAAVIAKTLINRGEPFTIYTWRDDEWFMVGEPFHMDEGPLNKINSLNMNYLEALVESERVSPTAWNKFEDGAPILWERAWNGCVQILGDDTPSNPAGEIHDPEN